MATESELSEAMRWRAERADIADAIASLEDALGSARVRKAGSRRPIAITFAAVATVAVILIAGAVAQRAASPNAHRATEPIAPRAATPVAAHQVDDPAVVNVVGVGLAGTVDHDLRADAEYLTVELSASAHAEVAAFAPSVGFGPGRVAGAVPVRVAGRPGLYGRVSVWPANGRPDPVSGKQNGATSSVAWQLSDGTWVVVQGDDPFAPSSVLISLADSLDLSSAPAAVRLPFTVGELPTRFELSGVHTYTADARQAMTVVDLTSPMGDLTIDLGDGQPSAGLDGGAMASRSVGSGLLSVSSMRFSQAAVQRVLDRIAVVDDPTTPSPNWPLLADALR